MNITLDIPLIPTAQMRARAAYIAGHATTYKHASQRRNEQQIMQFIADKRPEKPIDDGVRLGVYAYMPIPASWPGWKKEAAAKGIIKPIGKPDLDNLVKNIKDCMTQCGYWTDDSRVVICYSQMIYSESPGWHIELSTISQPKTKAEYEARKNHTTVNNDGNAGN